MCLSAFGFAGVWEGDNFRTRDCMFIVWGGGGHSVYEMCALGVLCVSIICCTEKCFVDLTEVKWRSDRMY